MEKKCRVKEISENWNWNFVLVTCQWNEWTRIHRPVGSRILVSIFQNRNVLKYSLILTQIRVGHDTWRFPYHWSSRAYMILSTIQITLLRTYSLMIDIRVKEWISESIPKFPNILGTIPELTKIDDFWKITWVICFWRRKIFRTSIEDVERFLSSIVTNLRENHDIKLKESLLRRIEANDRTDYSWLTMKKSVVFQFLLVFISLVRPCLIFVFCVVSYAEFTLVISRFYHPIIFLFFQFLSSFFQLLFGLMEYPSSVSTCHFLCGFSLIRSP